LVDTRASQSSSQRSLIVVDCWAPAAIAKTPANQSINEEINWLEAMSFYRLFTALRYRMKGWAVA
jgi:hypothetical protein